MLCLPIRSNTPSSEKSVLDEVSAVVSENQKKNKNAKKDRPFINRSQHSQQFLFQKQNKQSLKISFLTISMLTTVLAENRLCQAKCSNIEYL